MSVLNSLEIDRLTKAALNIWDGIAYDMCGSFEEAEDWEMLEIAEVAFDASRLEEYDSDLYELLMTAAELEGYHNVLRAIAA